MIPIILDTDPGIDDAAAIAIALTHPDLDLRLITTVAGNVTVDKTTANALKLREFFNKQVPVAQGADRPLIREYEDASYVHGVSGMDGYEFPPVTTQPIALHAVEAMRQEIEDSKEPITLLAVGALTNVALLIRMYPQTAQKLKEIIIMGGAVHAGNTTGVAEFNIYADPHAADIVFQSGIPLTMIGLDLTHQALLTEETVQTIAHLNDGGAMLYALFDHYRHADKLDGIVMHDVCVLYYLLHPERVETADYYITVQLDGPAMGATVADIRHAYHLGTNCTVGLKADVAHFNQWFIQQIERMK